MPLVVWAMNDGTAGLKRASIWADELSSSVFVIVAVEKELETTPLDVIVSEPIQISVVPPDEPMEITGEMEEQPEIPVVPPGEVDVENIGAELTDDPGVGVSQ